MRAARDRHVRMCGLDDGYGALMEFIPESLQALDELEAYGDDTAGTSLLDRLDDVADRALAVAPGVIGLSMAWQENGLTFTLVATDEEVATLDAVQYLASGPCVEALHMGRGITTSAEGLLSETRWREFALAGAAAGVHSTLTFPVVRAGDVVATINLYGHAPDTFTGRHQPLADLFGGWAAAAVANADLSFSTRRAAERAPLDLRDSATVDTATGMLAHRRSLTVAEARHELEDAAQRAGIPVVRLAQVIVDLHHGW
jgi:GAF domain-containing protein